MFSSTFLHQTLDVAPIHVADISSGNCTTANRCSCSPSSRHQVIPHLSGGGVISYRTFNFDVMVCILFYGIFDYFIDVFKDLLQVVIVLTQDRVESSFNHEITTQLQLDISPPNKEAAPIHVADVSSSHRTTASRCSCSPPSRRQVVPHLSGHYPVLTTCRRLRVDVPSQCNSAATVQP